MRNKLKQNKAITLIALIITVIVMLILVGVTVSVVINSNLLGTAKDAVDRTQAAYLNEGEFEYDFDEYLPEDQRTYKITYNLNEGVNAEGQVTQYKKGEEVYLLNPKKDGSAFQGWFEANDFSGERVTKIVNRKGNITLYAKWAEETPVEFRKHAITC